MYIVPFLISILLASSYFAYNHQWILIQNPFVVSETIPIMPTTLQTKKMVKLFFWHHEAWRQETATILWSDVQADALASLITRWLSLMDEEKQMPKRVSLQSVAMNAKNQEALCSFDRNPFNRQQSIFEKMMWLEGLFKSIRENDIKIQSIRFLVHHQPLTDAHLEFNNPLPLIGFVDF